MHCSVYSCTSTLGYRHAMETHLPGSFCLAISGPDITARRISALKLVTKWLLGDHATCASLVLYLDRMGPALPNEIISAELEMAMVELCEWLKMPVPVDLTKIREMGSQRYFAGGPSYHSCL